MKFSEYYNLNKTQSDLDFVDILLDDDTELFVDPWAIKESKSEFSHDCQTYLISFFELLLERIRDGQDELAIDMLNFGHEMKETHLGYGQGNYKGAGISHVQANQIYEALKQSNAIRTGLIQDIEDCALLIDGINRDKISDLVSNIIKKPLIKYTEEQVKFNDVDSHDVSVGYCWDNEEKEWVLIRGNLPTPRVGEQNIMIILVPKMIVRRDLHLNYSQFYNHEVLEFEQARHLSAGTSLVRTLKSGEKKPPFKKALKPGIPETKATVYEYVKDHPDLLTSFKRRRSIDFEPIENSIIAKAQDIQIDMVADIDNKIQVLSEIRPGRPDAYKYEDHMRSILSLIFYPHLIKPVKNYPMQERAKLVDVAFENNAIKGFFMDIVRQSIPSRMVYFEFKNLNDDLGNGEVDQLGGRLGVNTGKIGFLICRSINDRLALLEKCRAIKRNRGDYLIPLDDQDIISLLTFKKEDDQDGMNTFLWEKLRELE